MCFSWCGSAYLSPTMHAFTYVVRTCITPRSHRESTVSARTYPSSDRQFLETRFKCDTARAGRRRAASNVDCSAVCDIEQCNLQAAAGTTMQATVRIHLSTTENSGIVGYTSCDTKTHNYTSHTCAHTHPTHNNHRPDNM